MSVEAVAVKEECEWWNSAEWWGVSEAARAGLYAGHEVKRELVLGPEVLHQPIPMFTDYETTDSGYSHRGTSHCDHTYAKRERSPVAVRVKEEGGKWEVQGDQECFPLRDCFVRLERTPTQDMCSNMSLTQSRTHATESEVTTELSVKVTAKNYECPMCQQIFTLKSQLTEHVVVHIHTPAGPEWEDYTDTDSASVLPDQAVSGQPSSPHAHSHTPHTHRTDRKQRKRPQQKEVHCCNICTDEFPNATKLRMHIKEHIKQYKAMHFSCGICSRQFKEVSQILEHRMTHTEQYHFTCTACLEQFKTISELKSHNLIHRSKNIYNCEICSKQFTELRDLKSHKLTHSILKTYSCRICYKQFASPNVFKRHKRTHAGKPMACDICKEKFASLHALKKHTLTHKKLERSFSCEICSKKCTSGGKLNEHKLIHSGEKRFGCNICKRTFSRICNLTNHYKKHTGERSFRCGVCGRKFADETALKRHKSALVANKVTITFECNEMSLL